MGLLFIIVAGAVAGWVASVIWRVESSRGVFIELLAGVLGAGLGAFIISPLFDEPSLVAGTYTVSAVLLTLVGAAFVVASLNLLRPAYLR
ncbi:GlsB/YeaQ/YmgE family stress response membrane protein [Tsuneonella sp. HG222]